LTVKTVRKRKGEVGKVRRRWKVRENPNNYS
jgi:hypothetical protein